MGFLLSLNLIHWIRSFSTVGLETHLGLNKKAEGGKKTFTFSFSWEGGASWGEGGQARALARFSRRDIAQKSRSILCTEIEVYDLHLLLVRMHRNRGVWTAFNALYGQHLMRRSQGVRTAPFSRYGLHSFRGKSSTHKSRNSTARFPRQHH